MTRDAFSERAGEAVVRARPVSAEQARLLAEEYFNGPLPPDQATEVGLYAFDEGYVAWARPAAPAEPGTLPATVGGGCVVIDRATGEISIRPLLTPETVAEQWAGRRPR
ncbi:hypothetical protein Sme01_39710 [Sphaerisporangium melleum]|uniref:Immunity protein 35 domain-containing protein n=1 Tax=Sphaerisporangium melleum TaxID=321316 RepID=A0A917VJF2_9ACTN|nr:hypothetical protein [Sphaerisporangium melleum]GGK86321.1 hypothetical protein GCM10007964_31130 [Sphaerisporangium melleum]GII71495.1 hypothetical protein Sme01_39710 [Sphaerisporangium melleum]